MAKFYPSIENIDHQETFKRILYDFVCMTHYWRQNLLIFPKIVWHCWHLLHNHCTLLQIHCRYAIQSYCTLLYKTTVLYWTALYLYPLTSTVPHCTSLYRVEYWQALPDCSQLYRVLTNTVLYCCPLYLCFICFNVYKN